MNTSTVKLDAASVRVLDQLGTSRTTLESTTLDLPQRRIALVGSNGQGKTTLLRAIAGLQDLAEGSISVDGHDVATELSAVRSTLGFLFADPSAQLIMPTVTEDIQLSLRRLGLKRRRRQERATELLAEAGLGHLSERSVHALSGGERQLVALTGLLAVDPSVILADEPTSALDLVNRAQVVTELMNVPARLIVATHDLELARACDRVIWVHAGQVVGDGEPGEIVDAYVSAAQGRTPWPGTTPPTHLARTLPEDRA
ncbi:MAG: energy-coupling factor ABC transporter ATP-binding protein [Galactobacter sp.]|uniref:energy-coupling factor ABC transporter ATP-binding protein n=1 Tax=Galactobacter sp. TaxID=2676125 RepID=UPI0025BCCC56|nr:ABC transporter ATP-binding protein [Galactobacter sp.]